MNYLKLIKLKNWIKDFSPFEIDCLFDLLNHPNSDVHKLAFKILSEFEKGLGKDLNE
jgi:hypothetical protein